MKINTKRKISMLLCALTLSTSLLAVNSFADESYNESLAIKADLHTNETSACSSETCTGRFKYIWGNNSAGSAHNVWFDAQCKATVDGAWADDALAKILVAPGRQLPETKSHVYGNSQIWRLWLEVQGWLAKGCTATGFLRNK